jgi:hypothetical protein
MCSVLESFNLAISSLQGIDFIFTNNRLTKVKKSILLCSNFDIDP